MACRVSVTQPAALNFVDSVPSEYYRQTPPKVPHFLKTLLRRKLVLWFLASEILRDYWLSGVSRHKNRAMIQLMIHLALRPKLELPLECAHT